MVEQAAELGRRLERADDRQAEMSLGVVQHQHAVRRRQRVQAGRRAHSTGGIQAGRRARSTRGPLCWRYR